MNIFVLNEDPVLAAQDHCDKHILKMIIESGQMLCAAHWIGWHKMLKPDSSMKQKEQREWMTERIHPGLVPPWKMTHAGHPCTQWTQRCWGNYMWLSRHGLGLCEEYTKRYGKVHKSHEVHRWLNRVVPPTFEGHTENPVGIMPFAVAMPDEYKVPGDPVESYRNYYNYSKSRFAKWKYTTQPNWFVNLSSSPVTSSSSGATQTSV